MVKSSTIVDIFSERYSEQYVKYYVSSLKIEELGQSLTSDLVLLLFTHYFIQLHLIYLISRAIIFVELN